MTSKEFEESDLRSAAKAFGCEKYLPHKFPKLKGPFYENKYVQDAMKGSVSFSPDEAVAQKVSYAELLREPTRSQRRLSGEFTVRDQVRNLMTIRPGFNRD